MSRQSHFYGWKLVAVACFIGFANFEFPMYGASVINSYMAADFHFDRRTLGLVFGVFVWISGLPGPLVALCVRKRGVRFSLVLGSLLVVTGALLMALFVRTAVELTVVFGVLMGLGAAWSGGVPLMACVSQWFLKRRALALSLVVAGLSIGSFIVPSLVNRLIAEFRGNWRVGWWLIVSLSICAAVASALLVKERPSDLGQYPDGESTGLLAANPSGCAPAQGRRTVFRTAEEWTFSEAFRTSALWLMLLAFAGTYAGCFMFLAHGVVHLKDLGYTPAQAAFSLSLLLLLFLIGKLVVGALGDHIEPRWLCAAGLMFLGIGMALAIKASGTLVFYSYAVLLGLGSGMSITCILTMPANYFGGKAYPSILGVQSTVGTTAGAIGSYAGGYVFDHFGSYADAFYAVAIVCLASSVLMLLFAKPPARRVAPYVQGGMTGKAPITHATLI